MSSGGTDCKDFEGLLRAAAGLEPYDWQARLVRRYLVSRLPMRVLVRQTRAAVVRRPAAFGQRTCVGSGTTFGLGRCVVELDTAGAFAGGARG